MNDEVGYGLVMPFTVVTSKGGPFDDDSYVAGYEAGLFDQKLAEYSKVGDGFVLTVHTANLPQLDLIAMRYDYIIESGGDYDGWTHIAVRPDQT